MTMKKHERLIIQILCELLHIEDSSIIQSHSELRQDLGLDSMTSLIFLMQLEDRISDFKIDPETLTLEDLQTIDSVNAYILTEEKKRQIAGVCDE